MQSASRGRCAAPDVTLDDASDDLATGYALPGAGRKHRPTRMCLGCRERQPQDSLLRLQLSPTGIVLVERKDQRLPGRSAYICPHDGCLDAVLRRGEIVFKRAKYDKIIVRLEARQAERLRYAFRFAARRLRGAFGVGSRG